MKTGTYVLILLMVCFLLCTCTAQENISADVGQTVTLQCKVVTADVGENATLSCPVPDNYKPFTAVEWRRPDQDSKPVLVFRNGRLDPDNQHKSYQNRVDLQDKEMKDGDFSLILMNVMMEDTGRYECRVFQGIKNEVISSINLKVYPPGDQEGSIGDGGNMVAFILGSVGAVIVLLAVAYFGSLIYKRSRKNPNLPVPTEEAAPIPMPTRSESAAEPTPPSAPLMDPAEEEETEM